MQSLVRFALLTTLAASASTHASAGPALSEDWLVDSTGTTSAFTTIDQAMLAAAPGDRILVQPGSYPAFQFSRGVDVIGLGALPGDVRIERVDYHVSVPPLGYDTALSNLTVCGGGAANSTAISGNELAPGTLVLEGVVTCGGVFLHGAGDFYLLMIDSRVENRPGGGFLGAALDFGGGIADVVGSRVLASNSDVGAALPAGSALRVGRDAVVRVSGSELLGGAGAETGATGPLADGGDAVVTGLGQGTPSLRVAGDSVVRGGQGGPQGSGGTGVDLLGAIALGDAIVSGGAGGTGAGAAYGSSAPTALGYDPELVVSPARSFAEAPTFLAPGAAVDLAVDASLPGGTILHSLSLGPPAAPDLGPLVLPSGGVRRAKHLNVAVGAPLDERAVPHPRRRQYFQAFFLDPASGQMMTTNPVALTLAR